MDALELVARREALGLDQEGLAGLLQWEVAAVVECEESRRDIPAEVAAKLDELEFARDTIAGVLEDSLPGDVRTYIDDDAFWAAWPQMRGGHRCDQRRMRRSGRIGSGLQVQHLGHAIQQPKAA